MTAGNMIAPTDALKNMRSILTRVNCTIGRYKTLIVLVGTSSDSNKLHNNLTIIKDQMIDDVIKSRETFLEYCKSFVVENVTKEQRDLFERLYAFYLTSIEYFMQLISKYALMITDFCDNDGSIFVMETQIFTGTYDMPSIMSNQFFSKSLKSSRKSSLENNPNNFGNSNTIKQTSSKSSFNLDDAKKIEKEFYDLSLILHELHSSIHLSHWNIVPVIEVHRKSDDKQSQYSSDDDLDPNERQESLENTRKSGSLKRTKSVKGGNSDNKRPSVQIGLSQYYAHPKLLLKSSFWNRKRKIKLIVGLIIAFIIVAVVVIVPTVILLKPK